MKFKGAVFDLDGVVTDTAHIHNMAWKTMFDEYLRERAERENIPFVPFDPEADYPRYVNGKPRYKGVASFLASRDIRLPSGNIDDPPDKETVCGLGNRKNILYRRIIAREGAHVFKSTVTFIEELKKNGIRIGVASSSANTRLILQKASLEPLFETRVCGIVSRELGLRGKPEPDIFVKAAQNLGLEVHECIMVEDAISGVKAGKKGNFGLVLGVARQVEGEVLLSHGADKVVTDLGEITLDEINDWFHRKMKEDAWCLNYRSFRKEEERLRETLCTTGNGYFATRGCVESESASEIHYPGTYIAGLYNRLPSEIHGKTIYNNDLVNCPNWLLIEFKTGNGDFMSPLKMRLLQYRQVLHMRDGILERDLICEDKRGRLTRIKSRRIASMADPHVGAMQYTIIPLNYSDRITLRSTLDGNVINEGVARYRQLNSRHLEPVALGETDHGVFLHVKTVSSDVHIVMDQKTTLRVKGREKGVERGIFKEAGRIGEEINFAARELKPCTIEKIVTIFTSLDHGIEDPEKASRRAISRASSFGELLKGHRDAWHELWRRADVEIEGDRFAQRVARLHTYHLLVTASPHNEKIDAGIPARGLHGEAYRGHIFWDALYILPFYLLHFPEVAKAHLMYRYRRLDAARAYAREHGYMGAMYPWQTADGGGEETQIVHYNPVSGRWDPDLSRLQRHVSIAIFYNLWNYFSMTQDREFLENYGAEMMLEISRFWASIARFDSSTGRYHIEGVMGPDEYHEKYPDCEEAGLKDNAYTNIMVVWLLEKTMEIERLLPPDAFIKLSHKIGLDPREMKRWKGITRKMNVVITEDGIVSQFDGYMDLKEFDWDAYRKRYGSIHRLDRILKAEADSPDRYKVTKQADALMLFYLLPPGEIETILRQLGYRVKDASSLVRANYTYYEPRTSHGSTLSKVVHSTVSRHTGSRSTVWRWFQEAMESDIYDTQGGTTIEGIHAGVMAASLGIIIGNFAGISFRDDLIVVEPDLPSWWKKISFNLLYRGCWYGFVISPSLVSVRLISGEGPGCVMIRGKEYRLTPSRPVCRVSHRPGHDTSQ